MFKKVLITKVMMSYVSWIGHWIEELSILAKKSKQELNVWIIYWSAVYFLTNLILIKKTLKQLFKKMNLSIEIFLWVVSKENLLYKKNEID